MVKVIKQFEVWIVSFDPSVGSEITKSRPALVVSNDALNDLYDTIIVAPLTSSVRDYPSRYSTNFEDNGGQIAFDQIKCMDKSRFKKKIGVISIGEREDILDMLSLIFTPTSK